MLAIRNNLMAENSARHLGMSYGRLSESVERLSSGLRINSAKDDAAGLAVRELIRADIAALRQGARNANDGVSMLQAAEGALGEIDSMLIRMRELCEQSSTGTYSPTQKSVMQAEFDELATEITRVADTTDFNDINLLNSTSASVKISLGNGSGGTQTISVDRQDLRAETLGLTGEASYLVGRNASSSTANYVSASDTDTLKFVFGTNSVVYSFSDGNAVQLDTLVSALNSAAGTDWNPASTVYNSATGTYSLKVTNADTGTEATNSVAVSGDVLWLTGGTATIGGTGDFVESTGDDDLDISTDAARQAVESAITTKDSYRAKLGYWMNRLEYAASILTVQSENLLAAESRISDADVAVEMARLTRNQVLSQAGVSMLGQANSMPQMALSLLQG